VTKAALRTLLGLVAGLAIGVVISATSSSGLRAFATAIEPIGTVWVNAIRMTVIPLVVSLLIATIAEEKDFRAVGRLGGRAVALYAVILSTVALLTFLAAPPLFSVMTIDATSAASLRSASSAAGTVPRTRSGPRSTARCSP
jgi:proton glutamate symport protein